jgi:guanylate kinase
MSLIIITGPSAVGKDTTVDYLSKNAGWRKVVPITSRQRRPSEKNGKEYLFVSKSYFQSLIRCQTVIAWDYVLENYYGYDYSIMDSPGRITIVHMLGRMAVRVRGLTNQPCLIISLLPNSMEVIENRIIARGSTPEEVKLRLALAKEERVMAELGDFQIHGAEVMPIEEIASRIRTAVASLE